MTPVCIAQPRGGQSKMTRECPVLVDCDVLRVVSN